jgi:hypothetical protein
MLPDLSSISGSTPHPDWPFLYIDPPCRVLLVNLNKYQAETSHWPGSLQFRVGNISGTYPTMPLLTWVWNRWPGRCRILVPASPDGKLSVAIFCQRLRENVYIGTVVHGPPVRYRNPLGIRNLANATLMFGIVSFHFVSL